MDPQVEAALQHHDRIRRSTDLPLFYGRKEKDTVTPRFLVKRIEAAAPIAQWNPARQCTELYLTLRDRALVWWDSLENDDIAVNNWDIVKAEFLKAYEPRYTAKTNCTNFQDLVQRTGENVQDYYLRVVEIYKRFCEAKPAMVPLAVATVIPNAVTAAIPVANAGLIEDVKLEGFKEGTKKIERFVLHQLFIAGLKEDIRAKTMEAGKPTIAESVAYARELEVILSDRKKTSGHVNAVQSNQDETEDAPDGLDEEELQAVNALRQQHGKKPYRFNRNRNGSNGGRFNKTTAKCRYCHIPGHLQKECRKRKAANAPMVDKDGKPLSNLRMLPVQEDHGQINTVANQDLGNLGGLGLTHLNW